MLSTSLLERHDGYLCLRVIDKNKVLDLVDDFLVRNDLELAITTDWIGTDEIEKVPFYILHVKGYGIELEKFKESAEIKHALMV